MRTRKRAVVRTAALGAAVALGLAACGGGGGGGSTGSSGDASPEDVAAALEEGGELTVWAWEPTLEDVVTSFEEEYPNVDVNLVNSGTGNDAYTALQNAIKAGKGVPDVAQIEYFALPQFSLADSLTDLTPYGAGELEDTYTPGPWNAVQAGEGIFGLPMDSGPMALFYNKAVFDRLGVAVPTTWDEYVEAGRALHAADPNVFITNDTGDAGLTTSMIWQAGGQPFQVDGTDVTIDLQDEGSMEYAETWNTLIDEGLLSEVTGWTDEWYQGLASGSIASLPIGAWMPANLESGVAAGAGQWAVAPMPQWEAGANANSENGGSSLTVPAASEQKALAYGFAQYANVEEGVQIRLDGGAFPATRAELQDPAFLDKEFPYFGGQKVNQVLAEGATSVVEGWSYLPYQVYANSIFNDTVGQAYTGSGDLAAGLQTWQDALVDYGNEQGFTVNE